MKTYTLTCEAGHEPMTWTVEANSWDEAAGMFLGMKELTDHAGAAHPEMLSQTPEEMKESVKKMITPQD